MTEDQEFQRVVSQFTGEDAEAMSRHPEYAHLTAFDWFDPEESWGHPFNEEEK